MIEELFSDSDRQLLIVLATEAMVRIRDDPALEHATQELVAILSKLYGTDTIIVARRAYESRDLRLSDDAALDRARALYRDPRFTPRICDNPTCGKSYTGPSLYCSLECALIDK
jgi:hypothetical protein